MDKQRHTKTNENEQRRTKANKDEHKRTNDTLRQATPNKTNQIQTKTTKDK